MGGKLARMKGKELREALMQQGVYEHDLAHETWPLRDVLKALPRQIKFR